MYYCKDCNHKFEKPLIKPESHRLCSPPFEKIYLCPFCKSTNFTEIEIFHCRCCGARLIDSNGEFCSDKCKVRFEKLKRAEYKHKKQLNENALYQFMREVEAYNQKHNTKYSYGQYVAHIKPKLEEAKKCKQKKNI